MVADSLDYRNKLMKSATYASISVAVILVSIKLIAWIATDSLSLQATLIDSILDAMASLVNLLVVREAIRPADREHRFGHGKFEALAAIGQSIFITVSALWLSLEAFQRFVKPQEIHQKQLGISVMVVSIILTLSLVFYQRFVIRKTQSTAIKADSIHYASDTLINFSVIIAFILNDFFDWHYVDPLFGSAIAFYIFYTAWQISKEAIHILTDHELPDEERQKIIDICMNDPRIQGVHDLKTRSAGSQSFIQLHLEMDGNITLFEAHEIADHIVMLLVTAFPNTEVIVHQDPFDDSTDKHL